MELYKNKTKESGIRSFEIGANYLIVEFIHGGTYLYDYNSTGKNKIEKMKELALSGKGLATFINKYVRDQFAAKIK